MTYAKHEAPAEGAGEAQELAVLLDNLVIAQRLSRELREAATDQARSYLYDRRARSSAPEAPAEAGEIGAEYDAAAHCVTLAECPPGLFLWNGTLGFKSEYGAMEPVGISPHHQLWKVGNRADAYCADSGEYFWGGTSNHDDRAKLLVYPVSADAVAMVASHGPSALRAQPQAREDAQPFMWAYQTVTDGEWKAFSKQLERADGSICPGVALYTHPAPDALRVAVEALEPFAAFGRFEAEVAAQAPDAAPAHDDCVFKHWSDAFDMKGPKLVYGDLRRAASALATLQAEQGAK